MAPGEEEARMRGPLREGTLRGGPRGRRIGEEGGPGEEDCLDVPPLQRWNREKEGQMLEGDRCLL